MGLGIDYGYGKIKGSVIKEAGYEFVCRYLSHSPGKNLSKEEVQDFKSNGLSIVVVWETTESRPLGGHDAGMNDAINAVAQLKDLGLEGMLSQKVIYFACDDDFSEDEQAEINDYFKGVNSVIGQGKTGVYGGYGVVKRVLDAGLASYAWQTAAWSHHQWDPRVHIKQTVNGTPTLQGVSCDTNESTKSDYGQF